MDLVAHLLGQHGVDPTLALDSVLAVELLRHDHGAKMTAPRGGTRVAGVEVALVDDLDVHGVEAAPQLGLDASPPIRHPFSPWEVRERARR